MSEAQAVLETRNGTVGYVVQLTSTISRFYPFDESHAIEAHTAMQRDARDNGFTKVAFNPEELFHENAFNRS